MDAATFTALVVFVAVALGTVAIVLVVEFIRGRLRARSVMRQLETLAETGGDPVASGLLKAPGAGEGFLAPLAARMPSLRDIAALLEQGRTRWSLTTFVILTFGLAAALGLMTLAAGANLVIAGIAALVGASVPYGIARRRATMRLRRFEEQLPDAIDLIGRAIRAGHPLSAGLKMVTEETSDPVADEFRRVFEQQRFGLPFEETMYDLADRVPIVDTRILVTAILVQREVGGNLAEVLDNLAYVIRERFKLRRQLRVITAQGRLSGYILALLPIAVGFAIFLLNRPYVMILFEHPTGRFFLTSAIVLQIMGYLWIRRIVDIEI
jgi:tight adherence protein B